MPLANSNINGAQNFKVSASITGSAAANTVVSGTIFQNQFDTTGVTQQQVPPNQVWKITDTYVTATQSPDCTADIWIDNTPQNINWDLNSTSLALGTTRINPMAYMVNGGLIVGATSFMLIKLATVAANGTGTATVTLFINVVQYPLTK